MEILLIIISIGPAIAIPAWYIWLSPQARSTNELALLNKITKPFAEKKKSPEVLLRELQTKSWKYHQEKVDLFIDICSKMMLFTTTPRQITKQRYELDRRENR